ncbi:hypothetical protein BGX27_005117 [Mortierella sp. AM989]|nr:hypothetical protein BGX27_005117 [Mortierella sp. AM989]
MSGYSPTDNSISLEIDSPHTSSENPTITTTTTTYTSTKPPRQFVLGGRMRSRDPPSSNEGVRRRPSSKEQDPSDEKSQHSVVGDKDETEDSNYIEMGGQLHPTGPPNSANPDPPHEDTLTDRLHFHRPDRHLFPYRSIRENLHASRTFFRRFFLLILIIPAWVIPSVLEAKAKHEAELAHGPVGSEHNITGISHAALQYGGLKYVTLSAAGDSGGSAHGPELSKGANWAIFILNMLVMMHLGKAACAALEELVPRFGAGLVSLLDAMTSSSVELAVAAFALKKGLVLVVQAAMLGAILNNLLLMMGIAILVGGFKNKTQELKKETTQTSINILLLTCVAYIIPIALDLTLVDLYQKMEPVVTDPIERKFQRDHIREKVDVDILQLSKIMAVILLLIYAACLAYQFHHRTFMILPEHKHEGVHTVHERRTHFWFAGFAFVLCMAAQVYSANLLVLAVEGLGRAHGLNDSFVGFILLPIALVADLQEEVIAVQESYANHLDMAVSLMVGSCMQIALLVTPILVLLGWIIEVPMTLRFTVLEVTILAASILLINYLIADHETNWIEGVLLLAVFVICAMAFYYDSSHLELASGEGKTVGGGTNPIGLH